MCGLDFPPVRRYLVCGINRIAYEQFPDRGKPKVELAQHRDEVRVFELRDVVIAISRDFIDARARGLSPLRDPPRRALLPRLRHHLAWGYVDQPPLVPFVAWLDNVFVGPSAVALRFLPALAGGATVVVTALMSRELGGGRTAQVIATVAAATSPVLMSTFHLLSTAAFDTFFWSVLVFIALRILRRAINASGFSLAQSQVSVF